MDPWLFQYGLVGRSAGATCAELFFERRLAMSRSPSLVTHCVFRILLGIAFLMITTAVGAQVQTAGEGHSPISGKEGQGSSKLLDAALELKGDGLARIQNDESRIGSDDLLEISVFEAPEMNRTLRVSANGEISLELLGPVKASGLTPKELEFILQEQLRRTYMKDPHVGVFVRELESHPVSVVGSTTS